MTEQRSRDSRFREGALWCDSHRVRPPRCQECGRTFVRLSMDRDEIAMTDPATGPVCTRCAAGEAHAVHIQAGAGFPARPTEGSADMARGVGPGCVNWQEAGVYGERPLVEEALELQAAGAGPSEVAELLNRRHGLELSGHQVGQVMRKAQKARDGGAEGGRGGEVTADGDGDGGRQDACPTGETPVARTEEGVDEAPAGPIEIEMPEERWEPARRYDRGGNGQPCRIDVSLPGIDLHVTGASVEQLLERVAGAERLIGGMLP